MSQCGGHIEGSPFQRADRVRVMAAVDRDIHDVAPFIGRIGEVIDLDYSCGCGQAFPDDPMIRVRFSDGEVQDFWREELYPRPVRSTACADSPRRAP